MPCYFPMQATFSTREDGKKKVKFSVSSAKLFHKGIKALGDNNLSIPCGKCMGCRLEKSRQWALRCVHEAKMHEDNCFVTLTYDDDHLPRDGSLHRDHIQNFIKRLRRKFCDQRIRVFYCGEYGDQLSRPHYHVCLFNFDFKDKQFWKVVDGCKYFTSSDLCSLWPFGFTTVGALTFESAAYVARYCTKKINGDQAKDHYKGRMPEFAGMSLKPGIGKPWLEKYGMSDVFPHDECIARGARCKLPRYYDTLWERMRPEEFAKAKEARRKNGEKFEHDNSHKRLQARLKCQEARFRLLIRKMEK